MTQIKPRYRLGTQNMLDLAKDDATKIPEKTLFRLVEAVPSPLNDALVDGDIVIRGGCASARELDDCYSVIFEVMDGTRSYFASARRLEPLI